MIDSATKDRATLDKATLAELALWVAKNIAYNLDFIPADKLEWKPAPASNSVLEIINHIGENFTHFNARLTGSGHPAYSPVATIEAAQQMLLNAAQDYARIMRTAEREQLEQRVRVQGMKIAVKQAAAMLVVDTINHHGQITYIQTLLGDTQSHFDAPAFAHIAA